MMKKNYLCLILIGVVVPLIITAYADGAKVLVKDKSSSSQRDDGKAAVAIPDPCKSPSSSGPGPVPIPYPKTGSAADMSKGSKKVKTDGKQIQIKKKSTYKRSTGDEAPTDGTIKYAPSPKKKPVLLEQK